MTHAGWLLIIVLWLTAPAIAAEGERPVPPAGPIEVTSQQLEVDRDAGNVRFSGEVVAKRGTMTVYAEQLRLFFLETDAEPRIERLLAEGSVRVVDGNRVATAERLDYLQQEEKMTLSGNAKIHQGDNLVSGEEIILFLRENRSLVKSGEDGRVRAVFLPQEEGP